MNPYEILGISINASSQDVKLAYRKLAKQYHPDRNSGDDVKFKEIHEAYEMLTGVYKPSVKKSKQKKYYHPKSKNTTNFNPTYQELAEVEQVFYDTDTETRGRSIMVIAKITQKDILAGYTFVTIKKRDICDGCGGEAVIPIPCVYCQSNIICEKCNDIGYMRGDCPTCKGDGLNKWIIKDIKVIIKPNTKTGDSSIFFGLGETPLRKKGGYLKVVFIMVD